MEKIILIDGNSLLNRAYYATPVFTTKDGFPTNAVFGFIKLLMKIASDKKPEYLAVAFDLHAPTFRHKMYDEYKAGRKPMPDDLAVQLPVLKELLALMEIKTCELAGYEADDIIGTLAKKFALQTYIYTGDRDSYQLVDETTSVCFTKRGVSDLLELSSGNFKAEIGLNPLQIIDLKALMGDSSDHIPGVPGVGEKSAYSLLEKYGTLDGVYAHIDEIKGALQTKLINGKESAYFSYKLATIETHAPIQTELSDCVFKNRYSQKVRSKFAELEFKSLLNLNVFEEEGEESFLATNAETTETQAEEIRLSSVEEAVRAISEAKGNVLSCSLSKTELRVCAVSDQPKEYVFPIKEDLLSVGFYEHELTPLLKAVFGGVKRVLVYNAKELKHRLNVENIAVCAPLDDVALMKYIAEGVGGAESLSYALDSRGIPSAQEGYGIYRLYKIFSNLLTEEERKLYEEIELPLVDVLFDMEKVGVCVDEKMIDELSERYREELKKLTLDIYSLAGEEFNVNSPAQLGKILFEKLAIGKGEKKSKTAKGYSTTAEVLEKLADEHPIVPLILRYRQVQKLNSTYLEGFKPLVKNGKVHTTYNQTNTSTGRLSSANPNLQNIPVRNDEGKELRKIFKASEGNVLLDADYSQIELRLLAHFSDCKKLKEAYRSHKDIHTHTASEVFGVPETTVTPAMRRDAKAVNFGIIYGISAFGLAKDLSISAKKAKEYIEKYFATYDEVKNYMEKNVEDAKRDGFVRTVCGRRRVINEIKSSNHNVRAFGERAAMNMPLQGSSADIIKIAMIGVYKALQEKGYKAKLVLQVHDELLIDCPKEEAEKVSEILKREMENAITLRVPLTVDVGRGENWFDAH